MGERVGDVFCFLENSVDQYRGAGTEFETDKCGGRQFHEWTCKVDLVLGTLNRGANAVEERLLGRLSFFTQLLRKCVKQRVELVSGVGNSLHKVLYGLDSVFVL